MQFSRVLIRKQLRADADAARQQEATEQAAQGAQRQHQAAAGELVRVREEMAEAARLPPT